MKISLFLMLSLTVISHVFLPVPAGSSVFGVFAATSPCDAASRQLLGIPETGGCDLIKWDLALFEETGTLDSATYKLIYAYGLSQPGTNGIFEGGTKVERKGKWKMVRGSGRNSDAVIYQLDPDRLQETLSFQQVDDNLLHLLDGNGSLMTGNAGWSYTLSRIGKLGRNPLRSSISRATPGSPTTPALPATNDSSIPGTFVGRSPCLEVAREINKVVNDDCMKLKWELTLYLDPVTHNPTTYKLKGTFYRKQIGEGRWAIVKGTKTNPEAVVYQLDPDKAAGSLLFLKADDNILFFLDKEMNLLKGNGDFSYTLNRANHILKN